MDLAIVFDWFAQDSQLASELTTDPRLRLALMWASAAQQSDDEAHRLQDHAKQCSTPPRVITDLSPLTIAVWRPLRWQTGGWRLVWGRPSAGQVGLKTDTQ
jgi:hypothetical protein